MPLVAKGHRWLGRGGGLAEKGGDCWNRLYWQSYHCDLMDISSWRFCLLLILFRIFNFKLLPSTSKASTLRKSKSWVSFFFFPLPIVLRQEIAFLKWMAFLWLHEWILWVPTPSSLSKTFRGAQNSQFLFWTHVKKEQALVCFSSEPTFSMSW